MNTAIAQQETDPSATTLFAANRLENHFTRHLPGDTESANYRRQVLAACYSHVRPTPVTQPRLLYHAREVAELLGLSQQQVASAAFVQAFSGNQLLPFSQPYAMNYGGHQFGSWAGQLGDGRAINLGEVPGRDGQYWTLQLKGAGPTPYSRQADGLAVLRSSIREFLCSEAMHHLGIPTTRALSLVASGEQVVRDMFYDGHPQAEPGAIVCRVAPSFLRFGSFQLHTWRGELAVLRQLADYCLRSNFPQLGAPSKESYQAWFAEICQRTRQLILHWMRVGFVHGVMNTDNMSILGLTIDYGPYGWLEGYDPQWTPNTTDLPGRRYSYGNQPQVALWNLAQLAAAILPLAGEVLPLQQQLDQFNRQFSEDWLQMMAAKIGLQRVHPETDQPLISELLDILCLSETDMTIFFRQLALLESESTAPPEADLQPLAASWYLPEQQSPEYRPRLWQWLMRYRQRLSQEEDGGRQRAVRMNRVNPRYVLRNYLAQQAIDLAQQGDTTMIGDLLETLRRPYDEQPEKAHYFQLRPEWARHQAGCSMLSCSS